MKSQRKTVVTSTRIAAREEEHLAVEASAENKAKIAINERLADALWTYLKREKIGVEQFADDVGISRGTAYKLAGRSVEPEKRASPNLSTLRQFVEKTGVSADYLLGYTVPVDRDARTPKGDLARQLHDALRAGAPIDAPLALLGDQSERIDNAGWSKAVIGEMVATWWARKRYLRARAYSEALNRLAERLDQDSNVVDNSIMRAHMRTKAASHRQVATLLRSPRSTWRQITSLTPGTLIVEIPLPMLRAQRANGGPDTSFLEAPFYALGGDVGVGVAWRATAKRDEAWFIDGESLEERYETGKRFLRPLSLSERYARRGKGNSATPKSRRAPDAR